MEEDKRHTSSTGRRLAGLIIFVLIGWWAYSSFINTDSWTGYYYPDPPNYSNVIKSSHDFKSLDECRNWINRQVSIDSDGDYDYQCGVDCRYEPEYSEEICKKDYR